MSQFGLTWEATRLAGQAALQTPDGRVSGAMLQLARDLKQTVALDDAPGLEVIAACEHAPTPAPHARCRRSCRTESVRSPNCCCWGCRTATSAHSCSSRPRRSSTTWPASAAGWAPNHARRCCRCCGPCSHHRASCPSNPPYLAIPLVSKPPNRGRSATGSAPDLPRRRSPYRQWQTYSFNTRGAHVQPAGHWGPFAGPVGRCNEPRRNAGWAGGGHPTLGVDRAGPAAHRFRRPHRRPGPAGGGRRFPAPPRTPPRRGAFRDGRRRDERCAVVGDGRRLFRRTGLRRLSRASAGACTGRSSPMPLRH